MKLSRLVFLKLGWVTGVLAGRSVRGGPASGSVLQLMNASNSSDEQKILSGLV